MKLHELCALLAICSFGSIAGVTSLAVPGGHSGFGLEKRQDDVLPESDVEPADTKKLRSYEEQGRRFVVDHILKLQIAVSAFDDKNRKYNKDAEDISDEVWKKAQAVVNGDPNNCKKVAEKITIIDNLLEIAERINIGKEAVLKKVVSVTASTGSVFEEFTKDKKIAAYFSTYCKDKYKEGKEYVQAQLDKQKDDDEDTDDAVQAKPNCSDGLTHSAGDLTPIIDELKQKGNGPSNDNCCTTDMGGCQQLG
ncbi:MAG: hypothetical protein Q9208_006824 [Pyrenodesmia sp. 3 TL-2023]